MGDLSRPDFKNKKKTEKEKIDYNFEYSMAWNKSNRERIEQERKRNNRQLARGLRPKKT